MKNKQHFLLLIVLIIFSANVFAGGISKALDDIKKLKYQFDSLGLDLNKAKDIIPANKNQQSNETNSTSSNVSREERNSIKIVETTGIGDSIDSSKDEAIRQAVQKAVTSYVSSDLIVKNDEIIKDKVIKVSAGFVEKVDVISQGKRDDGLYETKIKATVSSSRLKRALEDQNIKTSELDSDSLFGEALTKLDNKNSIIDLWKDILKKFPESAVTASLIGKPEINPIKDGKVLMTFKTSIGWDERYRKEFINIMNQTGTIVYAGDYRNIPLENGSYGNQPVNGLSIEDPILKKQITNLLSDTQLNRSLLIVLKIKNASNEVVDSLEGCLSPNFHSTKTNDNIFISGGIPLHISVMGFNNQHYAGYSINLKNSKSYIRQKPNPVDMSVSEKDRYNFYLNLTKVIDSNRIREFKTVDVEVSDCSKIN